LRGKGLGILVRAEHRPTAAQVWLRPPEELVAFLQRWERACEGGR
jgi:trehalose 6-phosphate phosphatase